MLRMDFKSECEDFLTSSETHMKNYTKFLRNCGIIKQKHSANALYVNTENFKMKVA